MEEFKPVKGPEDGLIKDIKKAEEMALAEKPFRDLGRFKATFPVPEVSSEEEKKIKEEETERLDKIARQRAELAGKQYDRKSSRQKQKGGKDEESSLEGKSAAA